MLEALLTQIDRIYDLELQVNIEEFLISRETCERLAGESGASAVLVQQDEQREAIQVGVYIGDDALERLKKIDLTSRLSADNFALLCTAIEEVSHFAYLMWNAGRGKKVTQLELELQAEVDKFITSTFLLARRNRGLVPVDLLDRLFSDFELRDGLDRSRRERYQAASSFARSYCSTLVRRFLRRAQIEDLVVDVRRFYRLSQGGKIGHIYRTMYAS